MGNSRDVAQLGTKVSLGFYQNRYCDLSVIGEIEILIAPLVIVFCVALEKSVINWNSEKEWDSLGQMQNRPVLTHLAAHSLFHCLPFRFAFLSFLGTFSWGPVRNKDLLFCGRGHEEQLFTVQSFIGTAFPGTSVPSNFLVLCLPEARSLEQVLVAWSWRSRYWKIQAYVIFPVFEKFSFHIEKLFKPLQFFQVVIYIYLKRKLETLKLVKSVLRYYLYLLLF